MIEIEREEVAVEQAGAWQHQKWRWHVRGNPKIGGISREPLLDACRVLKSMGEEPEQEIGTFRPGRTDWDLKTTIGYGATQTVRDNDTITRFAKFKLYDR